MDNYSIENIKDITKEARRLLIANDVAEIDKIIYHAALLGKSILQISRPMEKFPGELKAITEHYREAGYKANSRWEDNQLVITWGDDTITFKSLRRED